MECVPSGRDFERTPHTEANSAQGSGPAARAKRHQIRKLEKCSCQEDIQQFEKNNTMLV